MKHPLLNPDSKHYQMIDGVESIERLEQMYTQSELMTWAKITAMKYRMRIGNKDGAEKEVGKIKTYEAYYKYLESLVIEVEYGDEKDVDVNEDVYNVCASHEYDCKCPPCIMLNSVGQQLMDKKRTHVYDKLMSEELGKGQIVFVLQGDNKLRDSILGG